MVMIVFPPPFQGGGIQHPSSARRRRAAGGALSSHIDITGILVGRLQRKKKCTFVY